MYKRLAKIILLVLLIILTINYKYFLRITFPLKHKEIVINYSKKHNLDPYLVYAVIKVESNFNERAISKRDAIGLMQITPKTGKYISELLDEKDFKKEILFEPDINIRYGCFYMSKLFKDFNGSINCVLAAYNGGEGNVKRWAAMDQGTYSLEVKDIGFKETREYVKRVKILYSIYKHIYK